MTYYDQSAQGDRQIDVDRPMMLLSTPSGRLSDRTPGWKSTATSSSETRSGMASGGDLSPGCVVFSCELILQELVGPRMTRALDAATGLCSPWTGCKPTRS